MAELFPSPLPSPFDDMSVEEVAAFCFSADGLGNDHGDPPLPLVLSEKGAAVWAVCAERYANANRRSSLAEIETSFGEITSNIAGLVRSFGRTPARERFSYSPYAVPLSRYNLIFHLGERQVSTRRIQRIREAEKSIEKKGLIKDPFTIEIPGYIFLVLGMVPYEFSIKTMEGKQKYLKMRAFLWDIEIQKGQSDWHFDGRIRVFKIAELIKKAIAKASKDEDQGRE